MKTKLSHNEYIKQWQKNNRKRSLEISKKAGRKYYKNNKEKVSNSIKEYKKKKKLLGLCRNCNLPRITETFCEKHRKIHSMGMIKTTYGLSEKEYDKLGIICMICGTTKTTTKRLHIDHNHTTGKIRGLLCQSCNMGIGRFKENPDLLVKASIYLKCDLGLQLDL